MTPDQVELVAQAFYAAEYSSVWKDAPQPIKARFRNLARLAIALLGQQIAECRASPVSAPMCKFHRLEGALSEFH